MLDSTGGDVFGFVVDPDTFVGMSEAAFTLGAMVSGLRRQAGGVLLHCAITGGYPDLDTKA